ncbi:MAG: two-component regulator propeller domain-containing protein, partial [Bacteroidota bacterium]
MQAAANRFFRSFLFILYFTCSADAQQNEFIFNHTGVKDGLSNGIVNSFCRDKENFLWIGTYDGLNRYDGTSFQIYKSNPHDSTTLLNNTVHDVCEDHNGNIWCATGSGISCYDKLEGKFRNYLLYDDSSKKVNIYGASTILCDRKGTIWCCSNGGLYEFLVKEKKFKNYRPYQSDITSVSSEAIHKNGIVEDPVRNGIWLATSKGLNYFDTDKKVAYNFRNNPEHLPIYTDSIIYPVTFDHRGNIHYGENNSQLYCIYDFNKGKLTTIDLSPFNRDKSRGALSTIFVDSHNNAWISGWNYKLYYIDDNSGKVNEFYHDDLNLKSVNSNFFWDVYEDKDGTIWIGGLNGISYYNPEKSVYTIYKPAEKFPSIKKYNNIVTFYEQKDGLVWFGADGAGLFNFNMKKGEYLNYPLPDFIKHPDSSGRYNSVLSIVPRNDDLWLGTRNGLYIFNTITHQFTAFNGISKSEDIQNQSVRQMYFDRSGTLYFMGDMDGFYSFNTFDNSYKKFDENYFKNTGIKASNVYRLFLDSKNILWISSLENNLLGRYNPLKDAFTTYDLSDKTLNKVSKTGVMSSLCEDSNGFLWITSTANGLIKFDPRTSKSFIYREPDGLAFDHCQAVTTDNFGRIWVAAYNYFSVYDTTTKRFENFSIEYGESDYQYRNKFYKLQNGNILSGMLDAIIEINPSNQIKKMTVPPVIISNLRIFEEPLLRSRWMNGLQLSYKENFFSIDYSILTGVDRNKYQFFYKLEGFDKDWVNAGKRATATYTNVPGGKYIFKVKAINNLGQESEKQTTINISITKIFYQTWWFRFLLAFLMFMVIRLYVRYRERQQKLLEAEQAIMYFANSEYTNSNAEEILWDMARNCISRLGFEDCVIYLLDEEKDILIQKAALGDKTMDQKTISNPIEIPIGKGIVGSVAVSGKTERINDTSKDGRYILDDAMRFSEIAVPIVHEGKVIGVIDSEHHKKHFFTKMHQRILETMASICATKIVNAQAAQVLAEKEIKLLEIDKKVAETRLMALRAQMNPHFIFNCLNAIDNYILKNDADQASRYLNKFARLVRSILSESDKNFISLKKELDLLNNYIELENLRLTEKFEYTLHLDPSIDINDTEIPTMVLQPFVENAIVHGLAHQTGKKTLFLSITLTDEMLQCIIEDSGVGREEALRIKNSKIQTHESKGMRVTEGRLELLQQEVKEKGTVIITDLYDAEGKPCGTRVEINVPFEE